MKPSILIIADFPNWAYYEIQQFIKNNLSDNFNIYCDYLRFNALKKTKNPLSIIKLLIDKNKHQTIRKDNKYDIVVFLGFYFPEYMNITWKSKKIVKGIYTDGFPPQNSNFRGDIVEFKNRFLKDSDAIVCGSELIKQFYVKTLNKVYYANGIIDESLFKRNSTKKINSTSTFNIGWTGNPNREFKGFYSHVIPAVELAQEKYPNIQLKTRFSGAMETLPLFYNNIDIVIIASDADAGPSLFGEASLMGVPAISTDIGWPHEVIKTNQNGFIVNKNIKEIANKIIELYEDRTLLFKMSNNIRSDYLKVFSKENMKKKWENLFNELLNE